ncbi:MAG TPA: hypothetical protein VHP83_16310 [Aggregatilineaceae bacterium]|nr:hypothetical protein [Aggregatilineaceae bacterium]
MPAPRQLGNRSKEIVEGIESLLIDNGLTFYRVMMYLQGEDIRAAVDEGMRGVEINTDALRACTHLLAGDFDGADKVLMEARKRRVK